MLLIHGKKTARIKMASDHHEQCKHCKAFDISVAVFRDYYHFYFIPFLPVGPKYVKAWCHACGQRFGSVAFEKEYENKATTPIYLYALPLVILLIVVFGMFANIWAQKEKANLVQNPKAGDIYLVSKDQNDSTFYYFLKIATVKQDTIGLYHNERLYFSYTSGLQQGDSFVTGDTLVYTRKELEKMLDKGEINDVQR